jgi:hypothetical protein
MTINELQKKRSMVGQKHKLLEQKVITDRSVARKGVKQITNIAAVDEEGEEDNEDEEDKDFIVDQIDNVKLN